MNSRDLVVSFQDTVAFSQSLALKDTTDRAAASSKIYSEHFQAQKRSKGYTADIIVEESTTFSAAKEHLAGRTAVLNFANPVTPGGGVQNGAMAQEECLCRSSNLYLCLTASYCSDYYQYHRNYPNHFYSDRLIYTESVTVFKNDDYIPRLLEEKDWFQVDVITCAAPYLGHRRYTNRKALKELFKGRIRNIFESAVDHNIDTLILGAFGCGAFRNPPDLVADAFKEVINENNYREQFKKIIFAIKRTDELPCPNLMAFQFAFDGISAEANILRFDATPVLAQAIGEVHMPSGRILKGDKQIRPYEEWKRTNRFYGRQFSILGDSVSTLEGYNPRNYALFYTGEACARTGVYDMHDTWWGKVINYFGGELLVNNSWSGSRVTKLPDSDRLFPSGCCNERTDSLHINGTMPDVIIVYMGTNDWAYGVKSGEYRSDLNKNLSMQDETVFSYAYNKMLVRLKRNYPNADIFCCTLCRSYMSGRPDFQFPTAYGGTEMWIYNEIIKNITAENNCKLLDLYSPEMPYDSVDGTHPTVAGMNTIATLIIRGMCNTIY